MNFGEFIAAFGNGYRSLKDEETKKTLGKELFCMTLLCSISSNEVVVKYIDGIEDKKHQRDKSAFQAYYRNTNRRSLHPIADAIVNRGQLDEAKFRCFLKNYAVHYSKEQLLINFQEYIPAATIETLFDDITEEFVKILSEAAAKPDKRKKPPEHKYSSDNKEVQDLTTQIESMLEGLIDTGRKISASRIVIGGIKIYPQPVPKLWTDLDRYFERLKDLTSSLHKLYSAQYPTIRELFRTVDCLTKEDCILSEGEYRIIIPGKERPLHKVEELLSELKKVFLMQPDADRDIPVP